METSDDASSVLYTFYATGHGLILIGTLLGNIGTIAAYWKVPGLRDKPSDLLILSLSCADLGIGLVRMMDYPKCVLGYWPFHSAGCKLRALLSNVCVSVGILNTAVICLDRFLLVSQEYPAYLKSQSRVRVLCKIIIIWVYGFAVGISEILLWPYVRVPVEIDFDFSYKFECRSPVKHNALASLVYSIIVIFLPLLVAEILSILFVCLLKRKLQRPASLRLHNIDIQFPMRPTCMNWNAAEAASGNASGIARNIHQTVGPKRRYKNAKLVVILVIALNVCLLPFVLYVLIISIMCNECNNKMVRNLLIDIVYLNSFLNPILYAVTMEKIRYFYRDLFCR